MRTQYLKPLARRTYNSVSGQVENLFELWSLYEYWKRDFAAARTLNSIAPALFGTLHRSALQNSIILIRQLADPATSRVRGKQRRNSSVLGLLAVTFGDTMAAVPGNLRSQSKLFEKLATPICDVADKVIAHTDLAWGLDEEPFPTMPNGRFEDCVRESRRFLSFFETNFGLEPRHTGASRLTAEAILVVKELAHRAEGRSGSNP